MTPKKIKSELTREILLQKRHGFEMVEKMPIESNQRMSPMERFTRLQNIARLLPGSRRSDSDTEAIELAKTWRRLRTAYNLFHE
jgi:hypothetical protein